MKKSILILLWLCCSLSPANATEPGDALPDTATPEIRSGVRHLIATGMEKDAAVRLNTAMLEQGFSANDVLQAQAVLSNALDEGVPVKPILNKAHEGMSKNVAPQRIIGAMEAVKSRYAFAYGQSRTLASEKTRSDRIGNTLAAALAAGITPEDTETIVGRFREKVKDKPTAASDKLADETFKTVRDMARLGVTSENVREVVGQALQHGFEATEMADMRHSFVSQSRSHHASLNDMAKSYGKAIQKGQHPQSAHKGTKGKSGRSSGHGTPGGHGGSGSPGGGGSGGGSGGGGSGGGSGGGGSGGGSGGGGSGGGSGSGGSGGGSGSGGSGGGSGSGGSGGGGGKG
jgi:hypothetical protein